MDMKYLLIYILSFVMLSGCQATEIRKKYYPNGQLEEVASYKGEKLHGPYKAYFENGQIRDDGNYENNRMIGIWKQWYENGVQMTESTYKNGHVSNFQFWDKDGKQTVKNGTGTMTLTYPKGNPMSQNSYKNCLMDGKWTSWHDNGQIMSVFYYELGKPVGEWLYWDEEGNLIKREKQK